MGAQCYRSRWITSCKIIKRSELLIIISCKLMCQTKPFNSFTDIPCCKILQVQWKVGNKYLIYIVFNFHRYHKLSGAKLSIKLTYTLPGLLGIIHPRISFWIHNVLNVSYLSIRFSIFISFGILSWFSSLIFGSFTFSQNWQCMW